MNWPGIRAGSTLGRVDTNPELTGEGGDAVPLLLTNDASLEAEVRRLAAAAGVGVEQRGDPGSIGSSWGRAPLVLVGADAAPALATTHPVRRRDVHVLAAGAATERVFRDALAVGAESVMELPEGNGWLVALLTDSDDLAAHPAIVIGVIGASGGSGASTLAAAIALEMSRIRRCLLVDADPLGGGVDQIAGLDERPGVRWSGIEATGRLGGRALRESLPSSARLSVLAFDPGSARLPGADVVRETLSAGRRGFDAVVIDLGRHPEPAIEAAMAECDHLFVVTALTVSAIAAASRLRPRLPGAACALVVRGAERGVDAPMAATLLGLPLAVVMEDQPGLDEAVVLGLGPVRRRRGPLVRAVRSLLMGIPGAWS